MPAKSRQPYVHEKYIPAERLLDPNDFSPNLNLVFGENLSEVQQRRLLRKMEKEQRLQSTSAGALEKVRRQKEEAARQAQGSKEEMSELQLLEQKLARLSSALDKKTNDRRTAHVREEREHDEQEGAMRDREMKRLRSSRKWALYQAVHLDEEDGEFRSPQKDPGTRALQGEHQQKNMGSTSFGAVTPTSNNEETVSDDTKVLPVDRQTEDISQTASPAHFERTAEKRTQMKRVDKADEEEQRGGLTVAADSLKRGGPSSGVAARAVKRKRIMVDL